MYGLTTDKKRLRVTVVFCSNTNWRETEETKRFKLINKRRTLIRSNDVARFWNVFWPNATTPSPGNVANGFTFATYKSSRSVADKRFSARITDPIPPRFKPAGANHSAPTASLNAYTPAITTDGGTHTGRPKLALWTWTHGQYPAP